MIRPADFRFHSYQAATFYTSLQFATGKLLGPLLADVGDKLDGDPVTIPVPENAPPEVPRIILSSKDGTLRLEISLARVDIRWARRAQGSEMPLSDFNDFAYNTLRHLQRYLNAPSGRLGLAATRFQPSENPGRVLAEHFCRPELLSTTPDTKGPLNRPENFEIHAHKRFVLGRFRVNSWVRAKSGRLESDSVKQPIILVEQDLNTLAEEAEASEFLADDFREFLGLSATEMDTILRLYFQDRA